MDGGDDGVFEVEDLLDFRPMQQMSLQFSVCAMGFQITRRHADGKDLYLVKWKGYSETSWEPDENIGSELADLKRAARAKTGHEVRDDRKRKKKGNDEKVGKKEKKKDKKKRKRGSSDRKRSSDSDKNDEPLPMGMMPPPGMLPPMPPGMMPHGMAFPPHLGPEGKGKGMPPMPGKGMPPFGKGMPPPMHPPPFGHGPCPPPPGPWFDPKGFPIPGKGMAPMKGFPGKGPIPFQRPMPPGSREASDMQRFASEKKYRLRDFAQRVRDYLNKHSSQVPEEKQSKAKNLEEALGLKLQGSQLPLFLPIELLLTHALCLVWLMDVDSTDEQYDLLQQVTRLANHSGAQARKLFIQILKESCWARRQSQQSASAPESAKLFASLERPSGPTPLGLPSLPGLPADARPEHWRNLIVQLYKDHNPSKLGDIEALMAKYKGRERTLYLCICEKYRVSPNLEPKSVPSEKAPAGEDKKVKKYRELITEIYKEHNPSKLTDLDGLLQKYKGREELVYKGICEKYHVEPKTSKKEEAKTTFEKYKQLIAEIYAEHNKEKLGELDDLLGKYKGKEKTLYLAVCHKYNIEPKLPSNKKKEKKTEVDDGKDRPPEDAKNTEEDVKASTANTELVKLDDFNLPPGSHEDLAKMLNRLLDMAVLHGAGFDEKEATRVCAWQEGCPNRQLPCTLSYRFELQGLSSAQTEKFTDRLYGSGGSRWTKLLSICPGTEIKGPKDSSDALIVTGDGGGAQGRKPFDNAVIHIADSLGRAVRECMDVMDSDDEGARDRWYLPWSSEENAYILLDGEKPLKKEVGVEYRRGCWTPRRYVAMHCHSAHHNLCGPDVQGRLPDFWRELADKLWLGILTLNWGTDVPLDTVVVIQTTGGHEAAGKSVGMPQGCKEAAPSACVIVTAPTAEELETANKKLGPLLSKVLTGIRANAAFAMHVLSMPQFRSMGRATWYPGMVLAARQGFENREAASSDSEAADEDLDPDADILSDAEPTDAYRPLRLSRMKVREAYLQGLLCLNCDAADHKHQECPFRKKVCWNCHGNHCGNDCPLRCRFCRDRHDYPLVECVKKVCRRVSDWKKSKPFQEQRNVLALLEQLMIKLEGFADIDLAKHNKEVQDLVKQLNEQTTLFPVEIQDVALSILDMKPPTKQPVELPIPPPPSTPAPKPYVAPKLPKDAPPPLPENKYPWQEKIFLDTLLSKGLYGSNVLSRVIGRGGMHHRRMESESGARVFFRGLGVSGRDMDLSDPSDCRLHISVKGEVPQQGKSVRRIIKEIVAELDAELTERSERGEIGPALDNPRIPDAHPFGFMLSRGTGPENGEPLKFRFPEEDGQTLNDMLLWLKQAKLPLELDSDTQWRTTLQAAEFAKMMQDWSYPSPYWFEEHDLRPTGLWSSLTAGEGDGSSIALQQGQGVRLSAAAVEHFSTVLEKTQLSSMPRIIILEVLSRLRGVVRRQVEDEQLLFYLLYPWAWFSDSMGRGLKLPYGKQKVHAMLAEMGRMGGKPTESQVSPPFRGFFVEWLPLRAGTSRPEAPYVPMVPAPAAPAAAPRQTPITPEPPKVAPPLPSSAPRGFCKYWLPETAFKSRQDLRELITGPGGSHFAHILRKYPNVDLRIEGQNSLSVPPAHRLHVSISSEDSAAFDSAAVDVLDLVETVCDMIGEELQMTEEQVDTMISQVRAEKYFEAHGIRTPLPTARPTTAAPAEAEFEFVDDDMELDDQDDDDDADTEDEDARTEASDCMSDVTEADGEVPKTVFDDI